MIYIPCLCEHVMIGVKELRFLEIRVRLVWNRTVCMQHHQAKSLGAWFHYHFVNYIDFWMIKMWRLHVIHIQQLHILYFFLPIIPLCHKWVYIYGLRTHMIWYNCQHFKVAHVASCHTQLLGPCSYLTSLRGLSQSCLNGPLTRYVKLRVAHAPGMPGRFEIECYKTETGNSEIVYIASLI